MVSSGPSAHVLVCGEPGRPVQGMTHGWNWEPVREGGLWREGWSGERTKISTARRPEGTSLRRQTRVSSPTGPGSRIPHSYGGCLATTVVARNGVESHNPHNGRGVRTLQRGAATPLSPHPHVGHRTHEFDNNSRNNNNNNINHTNETCKDNTNKWSTSTRKRQHAAASPTNTATRTRQ